jgi:hypothetical protein
MTSWYVPSLQPFGHLIVLVTIRWPRYDLWPLWLLNKWWRLFSGDAMVWYWFSNEGQSTWETLNIKPSNLSKMKKSLALGLDPVVVKTKLCKDEGRWVRKLIFIRTSKSKCKMSKHIHKDIPFNPTFWIVGTTYDHL